MSNTAETTRDLLERWREVAPKWHEDPDKPIGYDAWDALRQHPEATDEKLAPITMDPKYVVFGFFPVPVVDEDQAIHYAELICEIRGTGKGRLTPVQDLYIKILTGRLDAYYAEGPRGLGRKT